VKEDHVIELSKQQQVVETLKDTVAKQKNEFAVWESAKFEWEERLMTCEQGKIPLQKRIEEHQQTIERLGNRVKRRDATIAEKSEQFHHELAQLKSYVCHSLLTTSILPARIICRRIAHAACLDSA
jgi:hypothetical protein